MPAISKILKSFRRPAAHLLAVVHEAVVAVAAEERAHIVLAAALVVGAVILIALAAWVAAEGAQAMEAA